MGAVVSALVCSMCFSAFGFDATNIMVIQECLEEELNIDLWEGKVMYDSKTKMIKKGTIAHPSELGHYNFHYPDVGSECIFTSDAIVKPVSYTHLRAHET